MKPRRDDGDDHEARGDRLQRWLAAMKPRRDDGDDSVSDCGEVSAEGAAMKPHRDDGDDPRPLHAAQLGRLRPQ